MQEYPSYAHQEKDLHLKCKFDLTSVLLVALHRSWYQWKPIMYPPQARPNPVPSVRALFHAQSQLYRHTWEESWMRLCQGLICRSRSAKNRTLTNSAAHLKFVFQRMKSQCHAIKWSNHGINESNGQNCKVNLRLSVNIDTHPYEQ